MNAPMSIDDLNHDEIRAWLERALRGQEPLPRLTPDEFPHLGILRLEKTLKPATRDSLRDGALQLVRQEPQIINWLIVPLISFEKSASVNKQTASYSVTLPQFCADGQGEIAYLGVVRK